MGLFWEIGALSAAELETAAAELLALLDGAAGDAQTQTQTWTTAQAQPWERGWTDAAAAVEANGRAWARMDADAAAVPAASAEAAAEAAARLTVRPQDAQTRSAANADVMQRVASNGMEPEAGGASDGGAPHSVQSGAAAMRRGYVGMDEISEFFRRDSRRYDGGFAANR
ncbi:MAG: hypothetical protein LUG15_04720 [Oscillospiraceae bacterium]|nr:hypothetical protein [Oscillospiraceae bacterium]